MECATSRKQQDSIRITVQLLRHIRVVNANATKGRQRATEAGLVTIQYYLFPNQFFGNHQSFPRLAIVAYCYIYYLT